MAEYLWAVQDNQGRELISWRAEAKVSDVKAVRENGKIKLVYKEDVMGQVDDSGGDVQLHRWPAGDKLSDPVSTAIAE